MLEAHRSVSLGVIGWPLLLFLAASCGGGASREDGSDAGPPGTHEDASPPEDASVAMDATLGDAAITDAAIATDAAVMDAGTSATGTTYYVSNAGSDSVNGLTLSTPFRTLNRAVGVARPGDVIEVRAGTYAENVAMRRLVQRAGRSIVADHLDAGVEEITLSLTPAA